MGKNALEETYWEGKIMTYHSKETNFTMLNKIFKKKII